MLSFINASNSERLRIIHDKTNNEFLLVFVSQLCLESVKKVTTAEEISHELSIRDRTNLELEDIFTTDTDISKSDYVVLNRAGHVITAMNLLALFKSSSADKLELAECERAAIEEMDKRSHSLSMDMS